MYQYYLVKCIIPICIFTATRPTTDESCSCPHPRGITVAFIPIPAEIPPLLSPLPRQLLQLPRYYRRPDPHVTLYFPPLVRWRTILHLLHSLHIFLRILLFHDTSTKILRIVKLQLKFSLLTYLKKGNNSRKKNTERRSMKVFHFHLTSSMGDRFA